MANESLSTTSVPVLIYFTVADRGPLASSTAYVLLYRLRSALENSPLDSSFSAFCLRTVPVSQGAQVSATAARGAARGRRHGTDNHSRTDLDIDADIDIDAADIVERLQALDTVAPSRKE